MQTKVTMVIPVATAGDLTLTGGGMLAITGAGTIPLKTSVLGAKVASAAAVASQATVVVGAAGVTVAGTTYAVNLVQTLANGQVLSRTVSSTLTTATSAAISADLKLKAEAMGFSFLSWTLVTSTITIIGSATYPVFAASNQSNTTTTQTVAGSNAIGDYNDVLAQGGTPITGTTYDRYNYVVNTNDVALGGESSVPLSQKCIIFVDNTTSGAFATSFGGGWTNVTKGFTVNSGTAITTGTAISGTTVGFNSYNQQTA